MKILKLSDKKKEDIRKTEKLLRILTLRDKLDSALLKADAYEIERINEEFQALKKEFYGE